MKDPGTEVYRTLYFFAALYFLVVFVLPLMRNLQKLTGQESVDDRKKEN